MGFWISIFRANVPPYVDLNIGAKMTDDTRHVVSAIIGLIWLQHMLLAMFKSCVCIAKGIAANSTHNSQWETSEEVRDDL